MKDYISCCSATYVASYAFQRDLECSYCKSLNDATVFDNCKNCGAPLAPDKHKSRDYNFDRRYSNTNNSGPK